MICDLAETYGIFEYRKFPARLIAILASGLSSSARTTKKMTGVELSQSEMFLAAALDNLSYIAWTKTKDAQKGRNRPDSVLEHYLKNAKDKNDDNVAFTSPEEFEAARGKLMKGE